jgi:FkbM family methyltransferase
MQEYHLKQSPKTKLLNFFRRSFTLPIFEKMLVKQTVGKSSALFQKIIPPDYLYKQGSYRVVTRNGLHLKLDISHVVDHYIYFGYKDTDYASVTDVITKSKTILDIGANIGTTSLYFASLNPTAQIYSFEPHPGSYKRAIENISLNNFTNIHLQNLGLGEKKETVKLYEVNEHNPGMNRIIAENKNLPFKTIEIDALDSVCNSLKIDQIDMIKIDVEGFEYSVLKGAKETIIKSKPLLFIELDDNNLKENNSSAKELISLLISYGYNNFYRANNSQAIGNDTSFDNCHYDIIAK